jgi:hypothetical protein
MKPVLLAGQAWATLRKPPDFPQIGRDDGKQPIQDTQIEEAPLEYSPDGPEQHYLRPLRLNLILPKPTYSFRLYRAMTFLAHAATLLLLFAEPRHPLLEVEVQGFARICNLSI